MKLGVLLSFRGVDTPNDAIAFGEGADDSAVADAVIRRSLNLNAGAFASDDGGLFRFKDGLASSLFISALDR